MAGHTGVIPPKGSSETWSRMTIC